MGGPPQRSVLVDTGVGRPAVFKGEEAAWQDWRFKLWAFVGATDDHAIAAAMDEAEATAFQAEWTPSAPICGDIDMQLKYLLVMQPEGVALQIISQSNGGLAGYRALARR